MFYLSLCITLEQSCLTFTCVIFFQLRLHLFIFHSLVLFLALLHTGAAQEQQLHKNELNILRSNAEVIRCLLVFLTKGDTLSCTYNSIVCMTKEKFLFQ